MGLPRIDDDILMSLIVIVALFALASLGSVYLYGRFAKRARGAPSQSLPASGAQTDADRTIAPMTAAMPGRSGVKVLEENFDAFAGRALSARSAGRSLDIMYYLWRGDLTGGLLSLEVLRAADRGVRVRMLLDDINMRRLDPEFLSLSAHPNIAVRLFNPSKNRSHSLRRGMEMLLRLFNVTRRMHNKAWIVDGRLAIVGGRNIGDTYFDAATDSNSLDMDAVVLGPAVREAEAIFDSFWNSALVLPIDALWVGRDTDVSAVREQLAAIETEPGARTYLARALKVDTLSDFLGELHWATEARIISDPPEKTLRHQQDHWLIRALFPVIAAAESRVQITTAYFVPGKEGTSALCRLAGRGVAVEILTNSLASTNQITVHGAYAEFRARLLRCGVKLYEFRPFDPSRGQVALGGTEGTTLHGKSFTVDGRSAFIGSFNFDLRSAYLNTEMGLLVEDPEVVASVGEAFARATAPGRSYAVALQNDAVCWQDGERRLDAEPEAGAGRRLMSLVVGRLPIKTQL